MWVFGQQANCLLHILFFRVCRCTGARESSFMQSQICCLCIQGSRVMCDRFGTEVGPCTLGTCLAWQRCGIVLHLKHVPKHKCQIRLNGQFATFYTHRHYNFRFIEFISWKRLSKQQALLLLAEQVFCRATSLRLPKNWMVYARAWHMARATRIHAWKKRAFHHQNNNVPAFFRRFYQKSV